MDIDSAILEIENKLGDALSQNQLSKEGRNYLTLAKEG